MKNPSFVDPEAYVEPVVSKQEWLSHLGEYFTPESIEWLNSITNDVELTLNEIDTICNVDRFDISRSKKTSQRNICELLFNWEFFARRQDDSVPSLLEQLFRADLLNDERIKSIPLLFIKIGDKEVFHPWVEKIIHPIRWHCDQNKEFAKTYQAKLAQIRNNNGALKEKFVLYVDVDGWLLYELERPILDDLPFGMEDCDVKLRLWFASLFQAPDGIQIPRWNEENYLCRLLLDIGIISMAHWPYRYSAPNIVDVLFRDHTTSAAFQIICKHLKWRSDNMPQYQIDFHRSAPDEKAKKRIDHRREYTEFLKTQLPELFSSDIPHKYIDLLYDCFFDKDDCVQYMANNFLCLYLEKKLSSAVNEGAYEQIQDISTLFEGENSNWIKMFKRYEETWGWFKSLMPSAMKIVEIGDSAEKLKDMLKILINDMFFLDFLLSKLEKLKNKEDENCPPLSLEDFVLKYIPLELFAIILSFKPFLKQNEDVYQSMIKEYPCLSNKDALLERLLPYFIDIAMMSMNETLALLVDNNYSSHCYSSDLSLGVFSQDDDPWGYLLLCVLDQLCGRHEKEPELIEPVFAIFFKRLYHIPIALEVIKKYPQVQQLIIENCYKIFEGLWDTSVYPANSSYQVKISSAAYVIGIHKGLWYGLKPLLVALRKTRREWVDATLKANDDCVSNGNSNLVLEINDYVDIFRESLKGLRQDMANGLSDWLKPLPESKRGDLNKRLAEFPAIERDREGFDITYTEPDPVWRYAYVRAIADLGVDVDGKGHYIHSIMDMVAKHDTSEMVRKAAVKASLELKNLRNGWDGDEHYNRVTLAFWWIKQASRLALNLPIDGESALSLRSRYEKKEAEKENDWVMPKYRWLLEDNKKRKEEEEQKEMEIQQTREKLIRARLGI